MQAINDNLFELAKMTPHAPGFAARLERIVKVSGEQRCSWATSELCGRSHVHCCAALRLQMLGEHAALLDEYLLPLLVDVFPSVDSRVAYGAAWAEMLLRAKTHPQPPSVAAAQAGTCACKLPAHAT